MSRVPWLQCDNKPCADAAVGRLGGWRACQACLRPAARFMHLPPTHSPILYSCPRPHHPPAQDLDWRFAAAQEEMAKAAASADEGDATPSAAAETKPSTA